MSKDILARAVNRLIEGDQDEVDTPKKTGSYKADYSNRLEPVKQFFDSDLAKQVIGFLEQAKREKEESEKFQGEEEKKVESVIRWLLRGRVFYEGLGLLEPGGGNFQADQEPSMEEYFNSLVLKINILDLLDFFLTSSVESELDAIFLFFDEEMREDQAARLLVAFREVLPGTQVIQRPEDGCWVYLATKDEIDVLGTGEVKPAKSNEEEKPEETPKPEEPLPPATSNFGLFAGPASPEQPPEENPPQNPPPEDNEEDEESYMDKEEEQEEEEPDEADALRDKEAKKPEKKREKTKPSDKEESSFDGRINKLIESLLGE